MTGGMWLVLEPSPEIPGADPGGRAGGSRDGTLRGASWENPVTKLLQAASGGLGPLSPFLPAP